jgi:hypothetical protein
LQTVGNFTSDRDFAIPFFRHAKAVLLSNTRNAAYLSKAGVEGNVRFFPPYGLSRINGICPLPPSSWQPIDVLIYGHLGPTMARRMAIINAAVRFCAANSLSYSVAPYLWRDKDAALTQTKLVIHAPSEDVDTFPWAKAGELMAKRVCFLVEETPELHAQGLTDIVPFWRRDDFADLRARISQLLSQPDQRAMRREKCYQFMAEHYNMDEFLPKLWKGIINHE